MFTVLKSKAPDRILNFLNAFLLFFYENFAPHPIITGFVLIFTRIRQTLSHCSTKANLQSCCTHNHQNPKQLI